MPLPQTFSLLVLGLGSTGFNVIEWALRHQGERVSAVCVYGGASAEPNESTRALEEHGVRFVFGTENVEGAYDVCVASPGISEFSEFYRSARAASTQIMGEPEFAYRLSPERWCGITGTNGKTTTTALVEHLIRSSGMAASAVGNIGTAAISAVDSRSPGDWLVAELSSYQLATTEEFHPRVGVLLNITPDHLAWHRSHDNYARAKLKLFENMGEGDLAIVDADDPGIGQYGDEVFRDGLRVLRASFDDPACADAAFLRAGRLVVRLAGEELDLVDASELLLAGDHNVKNALVASAAALACGASAEGVREGLRRFGPLEHRAEPCGEIDGVRYVNDSKATNTDAVEKALASFPDDRVILLLGGHDKGTPLDEFASFVVDHASCAVCFGESRERFRRALEDADRSGVIDIAEADDLYDAVDVARSLASCGDVVLLSPACSSFDQFSCFEERGRAFKAYVDKIRIALDEGEQFDTEE